MRLLCVCVLFAVCRYRWRRRRRLRQQGAIGSIAPDKPHMQWHYCYLHSLRSPCSSACVGSVAISTHTFTPLKRVLACARAAWPRRGAARICAYYSLLRANGVRIAKRCCCCCCCVCLCVLGSIVCAHDRRSAHSVSIRARAPVRQRERQRITKQNKHEHTATITQDWFVRGTTRVRLRGRSTTDDRRCVRFNECTGRWVLAGLFPTHYWSLAENYDRQCVFCA